jgi:hypothetical protein
MTNIARRRNPRLRLKSLLFWSRLWRPGEPQSLFQAANNGHDTVINLGNHDSITLANVQLAELHASNFIVHPLIIG